MARSIKQVAKGLVAEVYTDDRGIFQRGNIFSVSQLEKMATDIDASVSSRKTEIQAMITEANKE